MALLDFNKLKKQAEASINVVKQSTQKATDWASKAVSSASSNIADTVSNAGNNAFEYAVNTILKLTNGINFDGLIETVQRFGREKNRDVSATVDFLNRLKKLPEDGE